jgi:hypothetical protein
MTDFRNDERSPAASNTSIGFGFGGAAEGGNTPAAESTMTPSLVGSEAPLRQHLHHHNISTASSSTPDLDALARSNEARGVSDVENGALGEDSTTYDTPGKRWKWIPLPVWKAGRKVVVWVHGPKPPRRYRISPLFPAVQEFPLVISNRVLPKNRDRKLATFIVWAIWLIIFSLVKHQEESKAEIQGWGVPQDISCGATYWSPGNDCGIDGVDCRPFNASGTAFRCEAFCQSYQVLNPRAVGKQEVVYAPLVIGGPPNDVAKDDDDYDLDRAVYRADSHICNAAIHAGVVSNTVGGCGVVRLVGTHVNYTASKRHGISSVGFDTYFPSSYMFDEPVECGSLDNRWILLGVSVTITALLSLFTSSPAYFFWPTFVILFWQMGLASDPPTHSSTPALVSTLLARFLPAMFIAWVIFDKMGVRRTLDGLTAQIEKTVLWLGGAWVSSLDNYTWSKVIPIQRLNAHDLEQQPGAKAALVVIIIILVAALLWQAWCYRQEGRLTPRLKFYGLILVGILLSLSLPGLSLRIHHYIIGLVLIPGTAMQTRVSLLFQGLLFGWFINGAARWGFDAILQTPDELQNDAQLGSALPEILEPIISLATANATATAAAVVSATATALSSITFKWGAVPVGGTYDGISVLVNDVERYRGYFGDDVSDWTWTRDQKEENLHVPEYFRFAYMSGTSTQDYTKAGVWDPDGEWVHMLDGPSKVKRDGGDVLLSGDKAMNQK